MPSNGIISQPSAHSVDATVEKLQNRAASQRRNALCRDRSQRGSTEKVGLEMPPTKLLIFGNPKGGHAP